MTAWIAYASEASWQRESIEVLGVGESDITAHYVVDLKAFQAVENDRQHDVIPQRENIEGFARCKGIRVFMLLGDG